MPDKLSIVIPAYNEADWIEASLLALQPIRQQGHEVIVVDGGSLDNTLQYARSLADTVISTQRGRALQMNLGARHASHDYLLFVHADTLLPNDSANLVISSLRENRHSWGRFTLRLSGKAIQYRIIERLINLRSGVTRISTGDQGLFLSRSLFDQLDGFPNIPLMEDVAICKKLKAYSRPVCIPYAVISSSRRWEEQGILRTILVMWLLRLAYFLGVSPHTLVRHYYKADVSH